jgi:hypothetical protein
MEDDTHILDAMVRHMEKMYIINDEEVAYMEATATSTPTTHERDYKGMDIGVDDDAMILLVDMMTCGSLHATFTITYASIYPCDTCDATVDHVHMPIGYDMSINMPCYERCTFSPIACNMLNNCSFTCFACNDDNNAFMIQNEIAPIALSHNKDFSFPHDTLHTHHAYYNFLLDANGDVQTKRCIMIDDVFIYHAHMFFLLSIVCVGMRTTMSTSIEHEFTKRTLESIISVSSRSNPTAITCFASKTLKNFSSIWFLCKHVGDLCAICDNLVHVILNIEALCVATNMLTNFSFLCFVCNNNVVLDMTCHAYSQLSYIDVAPNKLTNYSFFWVGCMLIGGASHLVGNPKRKV